MSWHLSRLHFLLLNFEKIEILKHVPDSAFSIALYWTIVIIFPWRGNLTLRWRYLYIVTPSTETRTFPLQGILLPICLYEPQGKRIVFLCSSVWRRKIKRNKVMLPWMNSRINLWPHINIRLCRPDFQEAEMSSTLLFFPARLRLETKDLSALPLQIFLSRIGLFFLVCI